jgi:hypothetical protein
MAAATDARSLASPHPTGNVDVKATVYGIGRLLPSVVKDVMKLSFKKTSDSARAIASERERASEREVSLTVKK